MPRTGESKVQWYSRNGRAGRSPASHEQNHLHSTQSVSAHRPRWITSLLLPIKSMICRSEMARFDAVVIRRRSPHQL